MSNARLQALFEHYAKDRPLTPSLKLRLILTKVEIQMFFVIDHIPTPTPTHTRTRRGRVSKPPSRFSEQKFVRGSGAIKRQGYDHTELTDDESDE